MLNSRKSRRKKIIMCELRNNGVTYAGWAKGIARKEE